MSTTTIQRQLLADCVRAVSVQGGCGIKLADVNNQTVKALLRKKLVTIEKRRGFERVRPTDAGRQRVNGGIQA